MSRSNQNTYRAPKGNGSIRKVTRTRNGKSYVYWEGRYTIGVDPATGKSKRKSVYGDTKQEVAEKLREVTSQLDAGTYIEPCALKLGEWMTTWLADYQLSVKESTKYKYERDVELYILPNLGAIKLSALEVTHIQKFYNSLSSPPHSLSAKTVKDIHGILHKALKQAICNGYIKYNPAEGCVLPRIVKKEIQPLEGEKVGEFLKAVDGHVHEYLYKIAVFTGMRESEILGLSWDCIDLEKGTLIVKQQLRKHQEKGGGYYISTPKNDKKRVLTLPPTLIELFKLQKQKCEEMKEKADLCWHDKVRLYSELESKEVDVDFVFRNELGNRLSYRTVYDCFKRIVAEIGIPDTRFHDLRHTYATIALECGDDIKTLQENMGHHSSKFTLDVYGHYTSKMREESASRMERFINNITA